MIIASFEWYKKKNLHILKGEQLLFAQIKATDHNVECITPHTVADPGGGYFSANTLKSPLNWLKFTKKSWGQAKTRAPPLFQILDPPLTYVHHLAQMEQNASSCYFQSLDVVNRDGDAHL